MIHRFKSSILIALSGLFAVGASPHAVAQSGTTLQTFYAIGLAHDKAQPYDFTGRVFSFDVTGFGTGTLIRRHTALTAAHVLFDVTLGFSTSVSFTRALYGNYELSLQQVAAVNALSGYQTAAIAAGADVESIGSGERDLGYVVVTDPPVDSNWGNFLADATQLTNNDGRFILGYPGVTFDGRTMAYIVPTAPYVELGQGLFSNDSYVAEPGFSGGPVYAVVNGQQIVVGELLGGNSDTTGEFNVALVRAIDNEAAKFIQDAEYTNGLIRKVKIAGPTLAKRGVSLAYTLTVKFTEPNVDGTPASTNRYGELRLQSDTPGTPTNPLTTITKISNSQFHVVFSTQLRAGATVNLTGLFDKNMPAPKSTLAVVLE